MKRQKSKGFTLVELLVVITIIGMLMAMLFPAIGAIREVTRKTACANNVRSLAQAARSYESTLREFPGYVNSNVSVGWGGMLMPYFDQPGIWNAIKKDGSYQVQVESMVCPSDPPDGSNGNCAYTANGLVIRDARNNSDYPSRSLDYITQNDGAQNTMLFSENLKLDPRLDDLQAQAHWVHNWWDTNQASTTFGAPAVYPAPADKSYPNETDYTKFYDIKNGNSPLQKLFKGMQPTPTVMSQNVMAVHTGGVNVGYCDGHANFLSEDAGLSPAFSGAAITVYEALVTPDGLLCKPVEQPVDSSKF